MGSLALCSEPDHLAQLSINNQLNKHSDIISVLHVLLSFVCWQPAQYTKSHHVESYFTKVIII